MNTLNGWLLVDKPEGWTSFDVVNKVRGTIARHQGIKPRSIKVGHSGTLDPMATGLLILAVGKRTKELSKVIKADKTYEATLRLGATSSTGDREGEITQVSEKAPTKEEINEVLAKFTGKIEQTPPNFSAIKVGGVAAYKRARRGEKVELKPRKVTIHSLNLVDYSYPDLQIITRVASGTYIRTLAEDIGHTLKTGAHLTQLRRLLIASASLDGSIKVDNVNFNLIEKNLTKDIFPTRG